VRISGLNEGRRDVWAAKAPSMEMDIAWHA
jgi:hypothetical protein